MCVWQMSFPAIIVLNKIMAPIFQIIHIWNKTFDPCVNQGLEWRRKVQTGAEGLFTFSHEAPETRLHKVRTGQKKVVIMHVFE